MTVPLWLKLAPVVFLLLWSGGYSAVRIGLADIEPIAFLALRYATVLALLLPAWAILRPPQPAHRRQWWDLAIVGALVQGMYFGATNVAIGLGVSAAGLALVLALQPILIGILSPRFAGEPVSGRVWLGLLLGLGGAAIAILAKSGAGETTLSGIATAVVALVFITVGTLYEKRHGTAQHPIVANAVQCGAGLALALPLMLALESGRVAWSWTLAGATAYLAIGNSIIAMTLLFAMLRRGQAARASALFFLVPPLSALIALVLLGEGMGPAVWIGMALATVGVVIARRG